MSNVVMLPRGCANELFVSIGEAVDSIEAECGRVTGFAFVILGEQGGRPMRVQNFSVPDLLHAAGAVAALHADLVDEERAQGVEAGPA